MRRFNPEKELSKIRNGNKKKIIISICALLVVGVLGYSFALYQVRHTQKLVFNTVSEFKKRDIYLSVLVNGETQNEFPNQEDGYAFSGYECDGDATVTFDPDKWIASVNSNGPDKCTIKFGPKNINYDTIRVSEDVVVDDANDVNLRYIGSDPSNYIWFNCLKYDDLTNENAEDEQHKCEKWRIVGIMNNMTIVNEQTGEETINQSLVKITKADALNSSMPYDSTDKNNWTISSTQITLNTEYLNGSYIDTPLQSDNTRNMIEYIKWNLGSFDDSFTTIGIPRAFYNAERSDLVYRENLATWNGKIALLYPSDYGYAVDKSIREECLETLMSNYNINGCNNKNWLRGKGWVWFLTPNTAGGYCVFYIHPDGYVFRGNRGASTWFRIYPTLYLKPNVKILDGEGTNEKPYIINVE